MLTTSPSASQLVALLAVRASRGAGWTAAGLTAPAPYGSMGNRAGWTGIRPPAWTAVPPGSPGEPVSKLKGALFSGKRPYQARPRRLLCVAAHNHISRNRRVGLGKPLPLLGLRLGSTPPDGLFRETLPPSPRLRRTSRTAGSFVCGWRWLSRHSPLPRMLVSLRKHPRRFGQNPSPQHPS